MVFQRLSAKFQLKKIQKMNLLFQIKTPSQNKAIGSIKHPILPLI